MDSGSHKYLKALVLSLRYTLAPIMYSYVMYLSKAYPHKSHLMAVILLNSGSAWNQMLTHNSEAFFLC